MFGFDTVAAAIVIDLLQDCYDPGLLYACSRSSAPLESENNTSFCADSEVQVIERSDVDRL